MLSLKNEIKLRNILSNDKNTILNIINEKRQKFIKYLKSYRRL